MAEIAQLDWIESSDQMSRARARSREAAERYGYAELAHRMHLDESTIRHQFEYRPRLDKKKSFWKPAQDSFFALFFGDRRLREEMLALCEEKIEDVQPLNPEEALRDIVTKARTLKWGEDARDEITTLYRHVKKRSGDR